MLLQEFKAVVQARDLLLPGDRVLAAVSGGLDSIVLLHLLHGGAAENGWQIEVGHFNHALRGAESDADEAFVREEAARLGLRCHTDRGDVLALAKTAGLSIEMAARELRHDFLARTARKQGCSAIVLAHHAQDQAELLLLRLLRGAGLSGLAGMPWQAPSWKDPQIRLVRPLLGFFRDRIEEFAREQKLRWREDSLNLDSAPLRNRVRSQILPSIRSAFGTGALGPSLRSMELLRDAADYLSSELRAWRQRGSPRFAELHSALQREWLRQELLRSGVPPDFAWIERLRLNPGRPWTYTKGVRLTLLEDGTLLKDSPRAFRRSSQLMALETDHGYTEFEGFRVQWEKSKTAGEFASREGLEWLDADKVGSQAVLRHWRPGDRFTPLGMTQPVKIGGMFMNAKIPAQARVRLVVAAIPSGEIFWVEQLRIGERFRLDNSTRTRLKWQWQRQNPAGAPCDVEPA